MSQSITVFTLPDMPVYLCVFCLKVARIEQTETPDMMQERLKTMKKSTKFDRVVKREVCQITSRGTEVFGQQVAVTENHQPNYMLALAEKVNF